MRTVEVGIRELQRHTSRVLERVEHEGCNTLVTRQSKPVALLVPIEAAGSWVLLNRPTTYGTGAGQEPTGEDWVESGRLRMSPEVYDHLEAAGPTARGRLVALASRIHRAGGAFGRLAMRIGSRWALVEFDGPERPIYLVAVDHHRDLRHWIMGGDRDSVSLRRAGE